MSESTEKTEGESYRLAMKEMLKPYLENLRRYGEVYPGAIEDGLRAAIYRQQREAHKK